MGTVISPLTGIGGFSNRRQVQGMYSTTRPFGMAAIRWTWISGQQVARHGLVERLRHVGDLHPLRHAAGAQQVDHDDVDRMMRHGLPVRLDALEIFAGADRRRQCVGDLGEALVVVARGGILEPAEAELLDLVADRDRLVHAPALIDVAPSDCVCGPTASRTSADAFDLLRRR